MGAAVQVGEECGVEAGVPPEELEGLSVPVEGPVPAGEDPVVGAHHW